MEFLKGAKEFTRNPLGIIALFISLIYGFASLLFSSTFEQLTTNERFLLVLFIVMFPILVLFTFYLLVTKHHGKLYAPADYQEDSSFLRTLTPEEKTQKVKKEAIEAFEADKPIEIEDLSTIAQSSDFEEFIDEIKDVEARAVRKISRELGVEFKENVGIGSTGISFDALLLKDTKQVRCIEVKTIRNPEPSLSILERLLTSAAIANGYFKGNFKLYVVVVYSFEEGELYKIKDTWLNKINKFPVEINIQFIDKSSLYNA